MYNEIVSKARAIARDGLRLVATNEVRQVLMRLNQVLEKTNKRISEYQVEMLSCDFETAQLNSADPKLAVKTEALANRKKDYEATIADYQKEAASIQKEIDSQNAQITNIEKGEVKVSAECLECETNRLIAVITEEAARKVNAELPTPDTDAATK